MMLKLLAVLVTIVTLAAGNALGAANTSQVNVLSYSSTNVTTSAYVQLIASTSTSAGHLEVCDTSAHLLKIASGAAGSETDLFTVQPSGCVVLSIYLVPGTRLSIEAIDANATTGFNTVSLLP